MPYTTACEFNFDLNDLSFSDVEFTDSEYMIWAEDYPNLDSSSVYFGLNNASVQQQYTPQYEEETVPQEQAEEPQVETPVTDEPQEEVPQEPTEPTTPQDPSTEEPDSGNEGGTTTPPSSGNEGENSGSYNNNGNTDGGNTQLPPLPTE